MVWEVSQITESTRYNVYVTERHLLCKKTTAKIVRAMTDQLPVRGPARSDDVHATAVLTHPLLLTEPASITV